LKLLRQFLIIAGVSLLGEILHSLVPLPIPASIYGLVLMLAFLGTGLIPLGALRQAGNFLVEIMPVMFIPATVGLIEAWASLRRMLIPAVITVIITTWIVMAVSGSVTQAARKRRWLKK
jgi:holin-like protein